MDNPAMRHPWLRSALCLTAIFLAIAAVAKDKKTFIPPRKPKRAVKEEVQDEIERSRFLARAVEPHSTQSGFVFLDVAGINNPLAGANLYLSGIRNSKGDEMIYFEIPMEKYLSYTPPK